MRPQIRPGSGAPNITRFEIPIKSSIYPIRRADLSCLSLTWDLSLEEFRSCARLGHASTTQLPLQTAWLALVAGAADVISAAADLQCFIIVRPEERRVGTG